MTTVADTSKALTLSLITEYPKAGIVDFYIMSGGKKVTSLHEGDFYDIHVIAKNAGNVDGKIFAYVRNITDNFTLGTVQDATVSVGSTVDFSWTGLRMPNHSISLQAKAGHYE